MGAWDAVQTPGMKKGHFNVKTFELKLSVSYTHLTLPTNREV